MQNDSSDRPEPGGVDWDEILQVMSSGEIDEQLFEAVMNNANRATSALLNVNSDLSTEASEPLVDLLASSHELGLQFSDFHDDPETRLLDQVPKEDLTGPVSSSSSRHSYAGRIMIFCRLTFPISILLISILAYCPYLHLIPAHSHLRLISLHCHLLPIRRT